MASGNLSSGTTRNYTYRCEWKSVTNPETNTSTVTLTHRVYSSNNSWNLSIPARTNSYSVAGESTNWTSRAIGSSEIIGTGGITVGSSTFTISHNDDGTKSVYVSSTMNVNATIGSGSSAYYVGALTSSGTITLDKIPRDPCVYVWANSKWNKGKPYTYYNKEGTNLGWVQAKGKQVVDSSTIEGVAVWVDDPDNPENSGWKTTVTKG